MPPHGAYEREGQHRHDDQGLRVGAQRQGKQGEYREQRHEKYGTDRCHRFLLVAGAFDGVAYPVIAAQGLAQEPGAQLGHYGFRGSDAWIHFGRYIHGARTVGALDLGQSPPAFHLGHGCERRLAAFRRSNPERVERVQRAPLFVGIPHHQAHVVLAALYALGLFAVESLPHLAAEIGQGDPQRLPGRSDRQLQFRLACPQSVQDAVNTRVLQQFAAKLAGDAAEVADVLAVESNPYFRGPFDSLRGEAELARRSRGTGDLPPYPADVLGAEFARFAGTQLHGDFGQVRAGRIRNCAAGLCRGRVPAHRLHDVQHHRRPLLLCQLHLQVACGSHKLIDNPLRSLFTDSQRHPQSGGDGVALQRHEEGEGQVAAHNDTDGNNHGRQGDGQRQDAFSVRGGGQLAEAPLDQVFQGRLEKHLDARESGAEAAEHACYVGGVHQRYPADCDPDRRAQVGCDDECANDDGRDNRHPEFAQRHSPVAMSEMRRQDHLALDKGKGEAADDGGGNDGEQLSRIAHGEQQRREGRHGGQDAEGDGNHHLLRALDSPGELAGAPPVGDVGALSHHYGVVHQHAEGQDEADQRDGVDRKAQRVHEEDGAEEGDGNARGHPQRQVGAQEQCQQDQHQQKALDAAVEQRPQAAGNQFRFVLPDLYLHAFGITGGRLANEVVDPVGNQADILFADTADLNQRRRFAVEEQALAGVLEAVHHPCDILHQNPGAVVSRGYRQVLDFAAPIGLAPRAQQHFSVAGLHRAAGQVERAFSQRVGDVVEGQVVARQRLFGDFNGYFVWPRVADFGMSDAVKPENVVAHPPRQFLERAFVGRAGNGNFHDHA